MNNMNFSMFELIINDAELDSDKLKTIFNGEEDRKLLDDSSYCHITNGTLGDEKFFWAYAECGHRLPYTDKVYNRDTELEEVNPRKTNQIEPSKQYFCLYSLDAKVLYLSNTGKKKLFLEYFRSRVEDDVIIKNFYVSPDKFRKVMKSVGNINFAAKYSGAENSEVYEIFSDPDKFNFGKIDFSLNLKLNAETDYDFILKLINWRKSGKISSLSCVGIDDKGFDSTFRTDKFIRKIAVPVLKDSNGMYSPKDVFDVLVSEIQRKSK